MAGKFGIGKGLSNTTTTGSRGAKPPHGGASMARGARQEPPKGCTFPGKKLAGTQTRNSIPTKR
jgi:hypothetical protein